MPAERFSATIVSFRSDRALLGRSVASLGAAILHARVAGLVSEATLYVVENGPDDALPGLHAALPYWPPEAGSLEVISGHGNVGYGRGNNLVLPRLASDAHLVM